MSQREISTIVETLVVIHNTRGYITYDDLMDAADNFSLPLSQIDQLASQVNGLGYKIYDHKPSEKQAEEQGETTNKLSKYPDYAQIEYDKVYQEILEIDPGLLPLVDYIKGVRPAQHGESSYLFRHIDSNDTAVKRLFDMHLRSVVRIAVNEVKNCDEDLSDLIQIGSLGLLSAIEKYDVDSDTAFGSYANYWIFQFISRNTPFRRNKCYFPVYISDTILSVINIIDGHICPKCMGEHRLCENLISEIMQKTKKNRDGAIRIINYTQHAQSIEVLAEQEFENGVCLSDYSICDDFMLERVQEHQKAYLISQALKSLTVREKTIIEMRYGFRDGTCWTLEECGTYYNVTRERIRQIEGKALRKLKSSIYAKKLLDYWE